MKIRKQERTQSVCKNACLRKKESKRADMQIVIKSNGLVDQRMVRKREMEEE